MANRVKIAKLEAEPETAAASKFMSSTTTVTDDLLLEIFVRLPNPRSAIQCSLVCKRWFSLISCPKFRRDFIHRRHDHQRPFTALSDMLPLCQLFSEKSEITRHCGKIIGYGDPCWISQLLLEKSKSKSKSNSTSLYEQPIRGGYGDIVSSFHDLLLISYSLKDYYICNPLTKQSVALPAPPVQCWPEHIKLVFEPPNCPDRRVGCSCGFSFSDSRFRVLLFNYSIDDYLFCSETGQWSRVILPFNTVGRWIFSSVVPCNGIFHFLDEKDKKLIAFDPFKDTDNSLDRCRSIDLPVLSGAPHNKIERRLGVVRNQVRLSQVFTLENSDINGYTFNLKIWELSYNIDDAPSRPWASWLLLHEVNNGKMENTRRMFVTSFHPDNGDVIFLGSDRDIRRYNIRRDKFEESYKFSHRGGHVTIVHPVWPTLIPSPDLFSANFISFWDINV